MASSRTFNSGLLPVAAVILLLLNHAVDHSIAGDCDILGGASRGLMLTSCAGRGNISGTATEAEGLCAAVVAPQGYECQEFEVGSNSIRFQCYYTYDLALINLST